MFVMLSETCFSVFLRCVSSCSGLFGCRGCVQSAPTLPVSFDLAVNAAPGQPPVHGAGDARAVDHILVHRDEAANFGVDVELGGGRFTCRSLEELLNKCPAFAAVVGSGGLVPKQFAFPWEPEYVAGAEAEELEMPD